MQATPDNFTAYTYQWYYNAALLPGETTPYLNATQTGNYTVEISDGTCVELAPAVFLDCFGTSLNGILDGGVFQAFPNPADDVLNLYVRLKNASDMQLSVLNMLGQELWTETATGEMYSGQLDLSTFSSGMYYVELAVDGQTESISIVVK